MPEDEKLVRDAREGDAEALETLLRRHADWIYNLALRMVWRPEDAEDATQEILLKVARGVAGFRGESAPRTWIHRVAVNHLLTMKKRRSEENASSFDAYGARIAACPDEELAGPDLPVEAEILAEESKLACTTGMLLCLDREQRVAFVLGAVFQLEGSVAAELLEITPAAFRKRLSRARRDLLAFMQGQCGLVDPRNPCRCEAKTRAFVRAGVVDPDELRFYRTHVRTVRAAAEVTQVELERGVALFHEQPFPEAPDVARRVADALRN